MAPANTFVVLTEKEIISFKELSTGGSGGGSGVFLQDEIIAKRNIHTTACITILRTTCPDLSGLAKRF